MRIEILLLLGKYFLTLLMNGLTTLVLDVIGTLAKALWWTTLGLSMLHLASMIQRCLDRRAMGLTRIRPMLCKCLKADLRFPTLLPGVLALVLYLQSLLDQELFTIINFHLVMLAVLLLILSLHHAIHRLLRGCSLVQVVEHLLTCCFLLFWLRFCLRLNALLSRVSDVFLLLTQDNVTGILLWKSAGLCERSGARLIAYLKRAVI